MLISDLKDKYPKVYELAIERCGIISDEHDHLSCAFTWAKTEEGHKFWECMNEGRFTEAKEIHPELFEEEESPLKNAYKPFTDAPIETLYSFHEGKNSYTFLDQPMPLGPRYEYMQITIMQDVLKNLNDFGQEGWQLVVKEGSMYTFMRNK